MNVRPDAFELIDAVREHLSNQVLPALTDPRLKFQTLVAAHVLGVVRREMTGARALDEALFARLAALLGDAGTPPAGDRALGDAVTGLERALCEAIERGAFDADSNVLHDALTARVEAALSIWNPAFLARVKNAG